MSETTVRQTIGTNAMPHQDGDGARHPKSAWAPFMAHAVLALALVPLGGVTTLHIVAFVAAAAILPSTFLWCFMDARGRASSPEI